jgi:hypothetical protein
MQCNGGNNVSLYWEDFGQSCAQQLGTKPVHLLIPGSEPIVTSSDDKLFSISFSIWWGDQPFWGTLEVVGTASKALRIAEDLGHKGVYCQARPDLSYASPETQIRVTPFRLVEAPLSKCDSAKIAVAEQKRVRRAQKLLQTETKI